MKISYMLKREDFYKVNQETLDKYYSDSTQEMTLYIYPELNAIITRNPSKEVKKYLYVEYNVNASLLKKILVTLYTRITLNTKGIFSSKTCKINGYFSDSCLVYPCNKKFRIFDFEKNVVTVIPKNGFPDEDIKKEIQFRTKNNADFIPPVISYGTNQYTEAIIDGYPLARAGKKYQVKKDEAKKIWKEYIKNSIRKISLEEYAHILHERFRQLLKEENIKLKNINLDALILLEKLLFKEMSRKEKIEIGISHGDLQPGNIWIENNTGKIYIIDWESYGTRSIWYDEFALNENLRKQSGLEKIAAIQDLKHTVILYEDLIFHMEELNNLPYDYNSKEFGRYVQTILKGKNYV